MKKKIFMLFTALVLTLIGISSVNAEETLTVPKNTNIIHTDADSDKVLDQGEEVCIDTECFYIMKTDDNKVYLMAKYNLAVGNFTYAMMQDNVIRYYPSTLTDATGLQRYNALGGYITKGGDFVGTVSYEDAKKYEKEYLDTLNTKYGLDAVHVETDVNFMHTVNLDWASEDYSDVPNWALSTTYWTDMETSSTTDNSMWVVARDENLTDPMKEYDAETNTIAGVRPIFSVSARHFKDILINLAEPDNGTLEAEIKNGEVIFTIAPDEGYELDEIEVVDNGDKDVEYKDNGDGTYTIETLDSDISINVTFKEVAEEDSITDNTTNSETNNNKVENPNTSDNILVYISAIIMSMMILVVALKLAKKIED